jgi:hypothetical protein
VVDRLSAMLCLYRLDSSALASVSSNALPHPYRINSIAWRFRSSPPPPWPDIYETDLSPTIRSRYVLSRLAVLSLTLVGQIMTRPPPDESPIARQQRLAEEHQAQQRSDLIDEEIKRDREAMQQAQASQRKLLLLGTLPPRSNSSGANLPRC